MQAWSQEHEANILIILATRKSSDVSEDGRKKAHWAGEQTLPSAYQRNNSATGKAPCNNLGKIYLWVSEDFLLLHGLSYLKPGKTLSDIPVLAADSSPLFSILLSKLLLGLIMGTFTEQFP